MFAKLRICVTVILFVTLLGQCVRPPVANTGNRVRYKAVKIEVKNFTEYLQVHPKTLLYFQNFYNCNTLTDWVHFRFTYLFDGKVFSIPNIAFEDCKSKKFDQKLHHEMKYSNYVLQTKTLLESVSKIPQDKNYFLVIEPIVEKEQKYIKDGYVSYKFLLIDINENIIDSKDFGIPLLMEKLNPCPPANNCPFSIDDSEN